MARASACQHGIARAKLFLDSIVIDPAPAAQDALHLFFVVMGMHPDACPGRNGKPRTQSRWRLQLALAEQVGDGDRARAAAHG